MAKLRKVQEAPKNIVKLSNVAQKSNTPKSGMLLKRVYVVNAVKKLLLANRSEKQASNQLFDDEQTIYLQVTVVKIPKCPTQRMTMNLKHSIIPSSAELLLITPDIKNTKKNDYDANIEFYTKLLVKHGIDGIKEIMPLHKLYANYTDFEMQRRLMGLFDFILCESSVFSYVMKRIGNAVKKSNKHIASIKLSETSNVKKLFDTLRLQTHLKIHPKGDTYTTAIGHTGMTILQVSKNVVAFANELERKFPGGFDNVRALYLKTALSKAIKFYLSAIHSSDIKVPVLETTKAKTNVTVKGTLSTMMDAEITVLPNGYVIDTKGDMEEE